MASGAFTSLCSAPHIPPQVINCSRKIYERETSSGEGRLSENYMASQVLLNGRKSGRMAFVILVGTRTVPHRGVWH